MIHELFVKVRDRLRSKGVPFPMEFGPTPIANTVGGTRLQMFRDMVAGDTFGPPRAVMGTTKIVGSRAVAAVIQIHAQSTAEGAQLKDHQRLADALADQCQVALHRITNAERSIYRITRAGLVDLTDKPEGWRGAVYELRFTYERPVRDVDWIGQGIPTGVPSHATTSLNADGPPSTTDLPRATVRI